MSILKFLARHPLAVAALLLSLVIGGCASTRLGTAWAGVSHFGSDNNILVAYNDRIALIDPVNGDPIELKTEDGSVQVDSEGKVVRWEILAEQGSTAHFFSTPVFLDEDTLIAATFEGSLLKINRADASIIRSVKLFDGSLIVGGGCTGDNCIITDLTLADGILYITGINHNVIAVDAADLSTLWTVKTDFGVWSKPVAADGVVYFASMDHHLYAIESATGQQLWKLDLGGAVAAPPVLYEDHLYIGTLERKIYAVSTDGEIAAQYATQDWVWGPVTVVDDIVYAADLSGYAYALNAPAGLREIWKVKVATVGIRPAPLVVGENVIVASRSGFVYWLDRASGAVRDHVEVGAEILSDLLYVELNSPLVVVSTVAQDRLLVGYHIDGGAPAFKYPN